MLYFAKLKVISKRLVQLLSENERRQIKKFSEELGFDYYKVVVFIDKQIRITQELVVRKIALKEVKALIRHSRYYLMTNKI